MPPKRRAANSSDDEGLTKKPKKATQPKLKKSKTPTWPDLSQTAPTGEFAQKCINTWSLIAPYDTEITEEQWKAYYEERSALDKLNTVNSDDAKGVQSEELGQDTDLLLEAASANVARIICNSVLDDAKKKDIARSIRGGLYYLQLWGNDEEGGGDNPRTVEAKTRLYSPFGIGTSIDCAYDYHFRMRMTMNGEHFLTLVVISRTIQDCDPKSPSVCAAEVRNNRMVRKPAEDAVKVFNVTGSKATGTTAGRITELVTDLLAAKDWFSPKLSYDLLCAAGTACIYSERYASEVATIGKKFKLFEGESTAAGKKLADEEDAELKALMPEEQEDEVYCVPQRMLLLAKAAIENKA